MNNERDIIMNTQPYAEDLGVCDSKGKATMSASLQDAVYTQGPWKIYCDEARGRPRCLIIDKNDGEIASVNPHRTTWNGNAELIAAAPQMLEALRLIAKLDYKKAATNLSALNAVNIARKAIMEATGEVV